MRTVALVVFSLAFPYPAVASSSTSHADATKTLERAILLAGPSIAGLPIVLAPVPPDGASRGVEVWMLPRKTTRPRKSSSTAGAGSSVAQATPIGWTTNVS